MKIYKIKNEFDLFSNGSPWPSFVTEGQVWLTLKNLRYHISSVNSQFKHQIKYNKQVSAHPYLNCSILEYDLDICPSTEFPCIDEIQASEERKRKKEESRFALNQQRLFKQANKYTQPLNPNYYSKVSVV